MKRLAAVMAAVTVVRLALAALVPLAPDESYYWVWSHAPASGYLDHPPMVALWIWTGTALAGQTALGVRLLGPLAALLASWMVFDTARALFEDSTAGVAAAALLNATLLLGVGTVIMTPDSPLLFFWTAGLWAVARLAVGGGGRWWLIAGTFGGLALDSKYTALFLWIGGGLWVLLVPGIRGWLRRWQPWAACGTGLALFAPVLLWNAAHGWIGFVKQGDRVGDWHPARAIGFLAELVGGQIGLATPLIFILCMIGLTAAFRRTWRNRDPRWSLLVALSLPPTLVFVEHAFGDRVQANWPAIVYPALAVAASGLIAMRADAQGPLGPLSAGAIQPPTESATPGTTDLSAVAAAPGTTERRNASTIHLIAGHVFRFMAGEDLISKPVADNGLPNREAWSGASNTVGRDRKHDASQLVGTAGRKVLIRWWTAAVVSGFVITAMVYVQAAAQVLPLPPRLDPIAHQLSGWNALGRQVVSLRQAIGADYVAVDGYAPASALAWRLPPDIPVVGTDVHWASTTLPRMNLTGRTGLLLRDVRDANVPDPARWLQAERIGTVSRPNVPAGTYAAFRVIGNPDATAAVLLPHR